MSRAASAKTSPAAVGVTTDRLGKGRLRDVHPSGRSAEVQLLDDGEEVTQMPKLDRGWRRGSHG
jgi:hypothetical protein